MNTHRFRFFSLNLIISFALIPVILIHSTSAQTVTGSISGEIRDVVTKQPLPGGNVVLSGTTLGATCDDKGYYVIKNVDPGKYQLHASIIGYESATNADVDVSPKRNR